MQRACRDVQVTHSLTRDRKTMEEVSHAIPGCYFVFPVFDVVSSKTLSLKLYIVGSSMLKPELRQAFGDLKSWEFNRAVPANSNRFWIRTAIGFEQYISLFEFAGIVW